MAVNYKVEWPMNLGAPKGSLEAKQPHIDDGLDVPDPSRYYSREFMQKESQHLWPRVWLLAGVTSDIPEEGDYVTFEVGAEEFVIVRQADGTIKAFYNVCSHRGNKVCLNERGSVGSFTCTFHGWKFGLDGKLAHITDEHTFNPKLIAHRPGMTEVRCETLGGIIFINMDGKAPPLRESLGIPPEYIEMYQVDKMHVVHHVKSAWKANWKTGVDAFYETYHLPYVHPQTQGVMEDFSQYDLYPNGASRMIVPICVKSHRLPDQETVDPYLQYMLKEGGIDPATFNGTAREVRAAIQKSKRERAQARRPETLRELLGRSAHGQLGHWPVPERADGHASGGRLHHAVPAGRRRSGNVLLRDDDPVSPGGRSGLHGPGLDGSAARHRHDRPHATAGDPRAGGREAEPRSNFPLFNRFCTSCIVCTGCAYVPAFLSLP
jgi:nitrite reductase/ring-hydroxylating ferredoxin subunit